MTRSLLPALLTLSCLWLPASRAQDAPPGQPAPSKASQIDNALFKVQTPAGWTAKEQVLPGGKGRGVHLTHPSGVSLIFVVIKEGGDKPDPLWKQSPGFAGIGFALPRMRRLLGEQAEAVMTYDYATFLGKPCAAARLSGVRQGKWAALHAMGTPVGKRVAMAMVETQGLVNRPTRDAKHHQAIREAYAFLTSARVKP